MLALYTGGELSMRHTARGLLASLLVLSLGGCTTDVTYFRPSAASGTLSSTFRCMGVYNSIYFVSYLPDHERFIIASAYTLPGNPTIFHLSVGKNYDYESHGYWTEEQHKKIVERDARLIPWLKDRTQPIAFSTDKIEISWQDGGRQTFPIPEIAAHGDHFEITASNLDQDHDFDIDTRLTGLTGDWFEVNLPTVTYEGATIALPTIRFTQISDTVFVPLNC
jgi:hypothetical protein